MATTAWLACTAVAQPAADVIVVHRVRPGDTLIDLLRPDADWRTVQRANRVADPRRLQPGSVLHIPARLLREQPTVAEVVHAYGEVSVVRGTTSATEALAGGATLLAGDTVRTGTQSSATLRFVDGSRVLVRPDSQLKLERMTQSAGSSSATTTLQLERGSADSQVPPASAAGTASTPPRRYELRTPHANLGVRGTEFRSTADGATTRVEVLEGRVGARQGERSEAPLAAGFGAVAAASGMSTRPLPPAPALVGLPARVERMPLRLAWRTEAPGKVRAQVFSAEDPPRLVLDGVFDSAPARWSEDIPDGRYELRVRAIGADNLEGRDTRAPFVLKARPEPPFVGAPLAGARTVDESVRFAWTRNTTAARVRLQVADTPDFTQPRIDRSDLDGSEARIALPVGTHHWRLASLKADGDQGPFGDAQVLTRIAPPPAPEPQPPQATEGGLLLRWGSGSAAPGTRWQVQVARDASFAAPLQDQTVADPQLLLRDPPAGRYYVRVKTIDGDGFAGPYGQPQQVEVPHSPWWWLLVPALFLLV